MIEQIKSIGQWFLNQTTNNKVAITLLAVLLLAYYDRADFKTELKNLKRERKRTDSTYVTRINNITRDFQTKIDECNAERIKIYFEQNEIYKKKFEEVFLKTDFMYQQSKKSNP